MHAEVLELEKKRYRPSFPSLIIPAASASMVKVGKSKDKNYFIMAAACCSGRILMQCTHVFLVTLTYWVTGKFYFL